MKAAWYHLLLFLKRCNARYFTSPKVLQLATYLSYFLLVCSECFVLPSFFRLVIIFFHLMLRQLSLYGVMVHTSDVSLHLHLTILSFLKCHVSPLDNIIFILLLVQLFLKTPLNNLCLMRLVVKLLFVVSFLDTTEIALLFQQEWVLFDQHFFLINFFLLKRLHR